MQTQLRHTRPDTTLVHYVKEIPDSVYGMVDRMYEGIAGPDANEALAEVPAKGGIQ